MEALTKCLFVQHTVHQSCCPIGCGETAGPVDVGGRTRLQWRQRRQMTCHEMAATNFCLLAVPFGVREGLSATDASSARGCPRPDRRGALETPPGRSGKAVDCPGPAGPGDGFADCLGAGVEADL